MLTPSWSSSSLLAHLPKCMLMPAREAQTLLELMRALALQSSSRKLLSRGFCALKQTTFRMSSFPEECFFRRHRQYSHSARQDVSFLQQAALCYDITLYTTKCVITLCYIQLHYLLMCIYIYIYIYTHLLLIIIILLYAYSCVYIYIYIYTYIHILCVYIYI